MRLHDNTEITVLLLGVLTLFLLTLWVGSIANRSVVEEDRTGVQRLSLYAAEGTA